MIWLLLAALAAAADGELVGVVFRPDGAPVPGASVDVGGEVVLTDAEGAFRVAVPEGAPTVTVSGAGGSIEIPSVPIAKPSAFPLSEAKTPGSVPVRKLCAGSAVRL